MGTTRTRRCTVSIRYQKLKKTNFSLSVQLLALNVALACLEDEAESLVYWVDTTGTFSADQALSILGKRLLAKTERVRWSLIFTMLVFPVLIRNVNVKLYLSPESVLARLRVSLAFDLDSANTALEEIKSAHVRL